MRARHWRPMHRVRLLISLTFLTSSNCKLFFTAWLLTRIWCDSDQAGRGGLWGGHDSCRFSSQPRLKAQENSWRVLEGLKRLWKQICRNYPFFSLVWPVWNNICPLKARTKLICAFVTNQAYVVITHFLVFLTKNLTQKIWFWRKVEDSRRVLNTLGDS